MLRNVRRRIRRVSPYPILFAFLVVTSAARCATAAPDSTHRQPEIELRLPADISFDRTVKADSVVTFSHATHVGFANNTCTGCHPKPFHMLKPTHRARHSIMDAGGSCGSCHDGERAFGVRDRTACGTCHAGRATRAVAVKDSAGAVAAEVAPRKGPRAHAYPSGESSPGRVTFRHETHLKRGESCAVCHPKPFGMRFTKPAPEGAMHERASCGRCHDGSRSFDTQDPAACNRCHVEGGARP
jgi:c(7)-type cytochrome triheme protein